MMRPSSLDINAVSAIAHRNNPTPSFTITPEIETPPSRVKSHDYVDSPQNRDSITFDHPEVRSTRRDAARGIGPPSPSEKGQSAILAALSVGAPLIASVVSSCTSGICADLTAILGPDPLTRPAGASAIIALLWCSLVTSLGATMTAVAGLAMSAGYHDAHVGITKKIARFLRQWHANRRALPRHQEFEEMRPPSPALSAITDTHREQHAAASFRAAVVSARLLGVSVLLLSLALAIYLFLLYPLSVALSALLVGLLTAAVAAAPLLPVVLPSNT